MFPVYRSSAMMGRSEAPHSDPTRHQRSDSVSALLPFVSSAASVNTLYPLPQGLIAQTHDHYHYSYSQLSKQELANASPKLTLTSKFRLPQAKSHIDKLPFEVRLIIANYLPQYDAAQLLRVNKAFFNSTVVRIYHTVIVDPSFSHFNSDVFQVDPTLAVDVQSSTFIKLKYSLKSFLRTITQDIPIAAARSGEDPNKYSSLISTLQFIELPDGFNTPFDTNFFTFMSLKRLDHLSKFHWESERELSFEVTNKIPNKSLISSLHLNLDFKRVNSTDFAAFESFTNLQKLSIEPFLTSFNLFHVFKRLLAGNNNCLNLRVLRLVRLNSNHGFLKNPPTSLIVLTTYIIEHEGIRLSDYEMNCILDLFILLSSSQSKLEELKALTLDSIVLTTPDSKRMSTIMNLEALEYLELKNITELQLLHDIHSPLTLTELYTKLDAGFLESFGQKLNTLKRLSIDYREGLRDTVPSFIRGLPGLEELDITIRWNVTKLCSVSSWKELCNNYVEAILKHATTLKKLSVDTKEDSVFSDLHKLIATECLMRLKDMKQLESLRLHGYSLQPCAPILVEHLPHLKYFELFGFGAGGAPHMGLQVVHDGVLDDWLRVQHVATPIMKRNRHIKFIKIDKCIFEVNQLQDTVVPRDGLDSWFYGKVRVCLHRDDFS